MEIFSIPCVKENILERKPVNSRMSNNLGYILLFDVMLSSNKYSCIATFQKMRVCKTLNLIHITEKIR